MPEAIKDGVNGFLSEAGKDIELANIMKRKGKNRDLPNELSKNIVASTRVEEEALQYESLHMNLA